MGYTVLGVLGRGGMGLVELAEDDHGRKVARKRVPLHGSAREIEEARRRIRREAEVLGALDHPGIVRLLAVEDDGADVVLVMEHYGGGTLADVVARLGPLDPRYVAWLADRLLDALAAAHRGGVVHRDLKPANILFAEDGRPAIADFGIAVSRDLTVGLTRAGLVMGTPAWMAPEQARGEPAVAATDVFALGLTLAFALTGTPPYDADSRAGRGGGAANQGDLMARAARGRPSPLPRTVPSDLKHRILSMLERDPAKRPAAASAGAGLQGPHGTRVRTLPARIDPRRSHRWALALLTVLAVLALVAALGGSNDRNAGPGTVASNPIPSTTATPCRRLAYQPCGQNLPAAFTDGSACTENHEDVDAVAANGCEAAPDHVDGTSLGPDDSIAANLIPHGDSDRYPMPVHDGTLNFCTGAIDIRLTAPSGIHLRVDVLDPGGGVVATAESADTVPGTAHLEEGCASDDSGVWHVVVTKVSGDDTADPYQLERSGDF